MVYSRQMMRESSPAWGSQRSWWPVLVAWMGLVSCVSPREFAPAAPTVPQPRLPMNDAYQGSVITGELRPRFVWEASVAQKDPIVYELQYSADPKLEQGVVTVQTRELSHQPAEPLSVSTVPPVGRRYYWRVRACLEESCSDYSRPWWINLGRVQRDLNGDGYADVVLTSYNSSPRNVKIYMGGRTFDNVSDGTLAPISSDIAFGQALSNDGDFNGDGFADLVVGANNRAYVYYGKAGTSFSKAHDLLLRVSAYENFGHSASYAGDINADGSSDILIGAPSSEAQGFNSGRVYVYYGGQGEMLDSPAGWISGSKVGDELGFQVPTGGDFNGDGFSDVVAPPMRFADEVHEPPCNARLYQGVPGVAFDASKFTVFNGETSAGRCSLGAVLTGDLDRDGFADLVLGENSYLGQSFVFRTMRVFRGGMGVHGSADQRISDIGLTADWELYNMLPMGDVNCDGASDLRAIIATLLCTVFLGQSPSAPLATPSSARFTSWLVPVGDMNGDGCHEMVGMGTQSMPWLLYLGAPGGAVDTVPDGTFPSL